jgi:hypothetical protein
MLSRVTWEVTPLVRLLFQQRGSCGLCGGSSPAALNLQTGQCSRGSNAIPPVRVSWLPCLFLLLLFAASLNVFSLFDRRCWLHGPMFSTPCAGAGVAAFFLYRLFTSGVTILFPLLFLLFLLTMTNGMSCHCHGISTC